jgi:signal peptidase I
MRAPSLPSHRRRRTLLLGVAGVSALTLCACSSTKDDGHTGPAHATVGETVLGVPSEAMAPTIRAGQRIRVRLYSRPADERPAVGTIVVFRPPEGANVESTPSERVCGVPRNIERGRPCARSVGGEWRTERFVKRIVAGPGDRVAFSDGHVLRNGRPVDEPYVSGTCDGVGTSNTPCNLPHAIRVPPDQYFLVGDNRGESFDSRFFGPVPRGSLLGTVTTIGVGPSPAGR